MLLTTPIFVSQFAVLYIVTLTSPQYLFASGAWLVPNSTSNSLNVMKTFATVLMLGQIAEEFHEISESVKVLRRSRLSSTSRGRLCCCWLAICAQYSLALMVMVASGHLILSRQNPIEPLWITYYVFMTLNFDNMLVKFIMYMRTMERTSTWKVEIQEPNTPLSKTRSRRFDWVQRGFIVWIPVLLAASVSIFSRVFNVLPMTLLRYGYVSNERPVVMFSSLSLPRGCCPTVASVNNSFNGPMGDGVSVSVPCLARDAPEDGSLPPLVYWVAWSCHESSPSSLQVREGLGSDGSHAVLAGRMAAEPLELVTWMQKHGFEADAIREVFERLSDDQGGVGMYSHTFPYVANIEVFPFPWDKEVAIYAIAENQKTGALSPRPAASNVLHSKGCPVHCETCSHLGQCRKCKEGYRITSLFICEACLEGCLSCQENRKSCSQCKVGFGLFSYMTSSQQRERICVACSTSNCHTCEELTTSIPAPQTLPCKRCEPHFGLMEDGTCQKCQGLQCLDCAGPKNCTSCEQGFALVQNASTGGSCQPCSLACLSCDADACIHCQEGFVVKKGKCAECAPHCLRCDANGPEACDELGCEPGYRVEKTSSWSLPGIYSISYTCKPCQVPECQVCTKDKMICEECGKDFGVTVAGHCAQCGLGCATCRTAGSCMECREGFVLDLEQETCLACADRCLNCTSSGPSRCDAHGCNKGWTAIKATWKEVPNSYVCRPCSDPDCLVCDVSGPGKCDVSGPEGEYEY
eukprot:symbB.v1.2.027636.t1/scaffold2848.1/size68951/1